MRLFLLLAFAIACCVSAGSIAQAQETASGSPQSSTPRRDPTAPSAEILKRLAATAAVTDAIALDASEPVPADATVEAAPAFPELFLKGLVLSDRDHGTALLEAGSRRVTVRLSRDALDNGTLPAPSAARLSGFSVQGIEFRVLDFNDRSLLLQGADRTVLVQ